MHWAVRSNADQAKAEYAFDLGKPDDPAGADRYYSRACPEFETSDEMYARLNRIVPLTRFCTV